MPRTPPKRLRAVDEFSLETTRRIQAEVIPQTEKRIDNRARRLSASIGRELDTAQRAHDS